jgi:hypothetical protein
VPGEAAALSQHLLLGRVVAGGVAEHAVGHRVAVGCWGGVHQVAAQPGRGPHDQPMMTSPNSTDRTGTAITPTGAEPADRSYRAG